MGFFAGRRDLLDDSGTRPRAARREDSLGGVLAAAIPATFARADRVGGVQRSNGRTRPSSTSLATCAGSTDVEARLVDLAVQHDLLGSSRARLAATLESSWLEAELTVWRWCASRQGATVRTPFTDADLAAWIARCPLRQRRRHGMSRWVLREAMKGLVPDSVRLRRQKTFFDPFYAQTIPLWLNRITPDQWLQTAPYLDIGRLNAALRHPGESYGPLRTLWFCATLALWLDGFRSEHG